MLCPITLLKIRIQHVLLTFDFSFFVIQLFGCWWKAWFVPRESGKWMDIIPLVSTKAYVASFLLSYVFYWLSFCISLSTDSCVIEVCNVTFLIKDVGVLELKKHITELWDRQSSQYFICIDLFLFSTDQFIICRTTCTKACLEWTPTEYWQLWQHLVIAVSVKDPSLMFSHIHRLGFVSDSKFVNTTSACVQFAFHQTSDTLRSTLLNISLSLFYLHFTADLLRLILNHWSTLI